MDYSIAIRNYIALEKDVLSKLDINAINDTMNLIYKTFLKEGNIYIFGNGGSSATASHFVNDFNKGISEYTEKKFRFVCLNDNIATVLAIANDISYDEIFRFQLRGKLKHDDIVIAISGSGNSKNVLYAAEYAQSCGNKVIGLTGFDGGKLKQICDISLHVPSKSMQITEDIHMVFDHMIMAIFYKEIAGIDHVKD